MKEKGKIEISVSTLILVITIVILGYFVYQLYDNNMKNLKQIEELKKEIVAIKDITNSMTSNVNNNENSDKINNSEQQQEFKINGTYSNSDNFEMISYIFTDGNVKYECLDSADGTYVIENGKIKITYTKWYGPEKEELSSEKTTEELEIVDSNTLKQVIINDGKTNVINYIKK